MSFLCINNKGNRTSTPWIYKGLSGVEFWLITHSYVDVQFKYLT